MVDNGREDVRKRIATSVVRDSRTGKLIIKMVNLLPVPVRTEMSLPAGTDDASASLSVISVSSDAE